MGGGFVTRFTRQKETKSQKLHKPQIKGKAKPPIFTLKHDTHSYQHSLS